MHNFIGTILSLIVKGALIKDCDTKSTKSYKSNLEQASNFKGGLT